MLYLLSVFALILGIGCLVYVQHGRRQAHKQP